MSGHSIVRTSQLGMMRAMWEDGHTIDAIADAVGLNRWTAFDVIRRNRTMFPHRRHHADWWRAQLADIAGMDAHSAADALGVTASTIWHWRAKLKIG